MFREIARVPLFPQRVLELLDELRAVTTALLESQSHQRHTLDAVNEKIGSVHRTPPSYRTSCACLKASART